MEGKRREARRGGKGEMGVDQTKFGRKLTPLYTVSSVCLSSVTSVCPVCILAKQFVLPKNV